MNDRPMSPAVTASGCAIVTGGVGTIGWDVCKRLASDGFSVAVVDVDAARLERLVAEIALAGGSARAFVADVRVPAQIEKVVDAARSELGPANALVNIVGHAGDRQAAKISEIDDELWAEVMALNLKSAFAMCRAVIPLMEQQAYGRIVNFSTSGYNGTRAHVAGCRLAYVVSKAAINGLTRQLAQDCAEHGITVNAVAPGLVLGRPGSPTRDKFEAAFSPEAMQAVLKQFPQGRAAEANEVAEAISFLCSRGAGYVSGQIIRVDGGKN